MVNRKTYIGIFLDLTKALDPFYISINLRKMKYSGTYGKPLSIFTDFLMDRTQNKRKPELATTY